jgi:acetyl esterase/lipase
MSKSKAMIPVLLTLVLCGACSQSVQEKEHLSRVCVTTYAYKTVGDLMIKADVHQLDDGLTNPVIVWIHGGALITGGRESVPAWFRERALADGYDIISLDYRLAPETKLPEIVRDLEDAFQWIHRVGPRLLDVDTSRVAVIGASAGGYLTLLAGCRVDPRPTVLVSLWGYGDLIGPWLSEPSTHPRHNQAQITDEDAEKVMSLPPIANVRDRQGNGWAFYQYCRQRGLWPNLVSNFDMFEEPEKFFPFMPLKNVTNEFPPTLLVHGTDDTDVLHEQSELMQEEFIAHSIPHELFSVEGAEHGLWRANPQDVQRSQDKVLEFINKYMK